MPKNRPLLRVLGENVDAIMTRKKINQAQVAALAKRAGTPIDQTTVGRVARARDPEKKIDPPTLRTIEALANGLGVKPSLLLVEDLDVVSLIPTPDEAQLSEAELADVESVRGRLAQFTPAQRDLFINSEELRSIAGLVPYFPVDKMQGEWTGPHAKGSQQVQQPKASYRKKRAR